MTPTFIIEWMGPYKDPNEKIITNILYLITGSSKTGKPSEKIRYVGKTSSNCKGRFNDSHKFRTHIGNDGRFWVGKIKGSNSAKNDSSAISKAEKILVHYLKTYKISKKIDLLNKKLKYEPKSSFGIVNRWFKKNNEEYRKHVFPLVLIPDCIIWEKSRGALFTSQKIVIEKET
jgi:hypothetical protein